MSLYQTAPPMSLCQPVPLRLRAVANGLGGVMKTLVAIAPLSAIRAESLLRVRSHRIIDTLFVLALLILPINAFVVTLFVLSNVHPDPTTPARWMRPCSSCRPDDQWRIATPRSAHFPWQSVNAARSRLTARSTSLP
jgi:hypothetical protein